MKLANLLGQQLAGDSLGHEWIDGRMQRSYSAVAEETSVLLTLRRSSYFRVESVRCPPFCCRLYPASAVCGF